MQNLVSSNKYTREIGASLDLLLYLLGVGLALDDLLDEFQ